MTCVRFFAGFAAALLACTASAVDENKIISAGMDKTEAAACAEAQASMKQLTGEMKEWVLVKKSDCQCRKNASGYFCSIESVWRLPGGKN